MTDTAERRAQTAPDPDDSRKPKSPTELSKPSWSYVARKTLREFGADQCTDLAAALTYYSVLAIFPALLAIVSILGLFSDRMAVVDQVLDILGGFLDPGTVDSIRQPIEQLASSDAAGVTLVIGVLGAIWSASGYVGAFARAMNRIYEIQEGRSTIQLRAMQLGVTVLAVVLVVLGATLLVLSGPVAQAVGDAVGLGPAAITTWNIVKWPVLALIAVFLIAVLYWAAPNIRQPKFRWVSVGSLVALVIWAIATVGFAFYIANFANYDKTYGSLGGVIIGLLWIWITNVVLLLGAELDSELERGRELQGGLPAEDTLQLPPRSTAASAKKLDAQAQDRLVAVRLRRDSELARRRQARAESPIRRRR